MSDETQDNFTVGEIGMQVEGADGTLQDIGLSEVPFDGFYQWLMQSPAYTQEHPVRAAERDEMVNKINEVVDGHTMADSAGALFCALAGVFLELVARARAKGEKDPLRAVQQACLAASGRRVFAKITETMGAVEEMEKLKAAARDAGFGDGDFIKA